jgi:processive 1,2-diacylglycerol beta-glucosyltransferase
VKTLVILSVSAGAGHVRCAEALRATAEARFGPIKAIHVDVMAWVPKLFKKYYADSCIKLVKRHPVLWGYLYHRTANGLRAHGARCHLLRKEQ